MQKGMQQGVDVATSTKVSSARQHARSLQRKPNAEGLGSWDHWAGLLIEDQMRLTTFDLKNPPSSSLADMDTLSAAVEGSSGGPESITSTTGGASRLDRIPACETCPLDPEARSGPRRTQRQRANARGLERRRLGQ